MARMTKRQRREEIERSWQLMVLNEAQHLKRLGYRSGKRAYGQVVLNSASHRFAGAVEDQLKRLWEEADHA